MLKPITWIHTADLHLDQPVASWYGCAKKASQRREDYRETFKRIISVVEQKSVHFLFIAGDFLEHGYVQASTINFVRDCFRRIPDTRVLISPGNHDPYRNDSFYYTREDWPTNVHIFSDEWEGLYFKEYDLTIYGRGFADYVEPEWIPPPLVRSTGINMMIVHGTFIPFSDQKGNSAYFPILEKKLACYPFQYVALGHHHKAAMYELHNPQKTRVCYPGSPEALNWKEIGERFVVYGTLERNRTNVQWIPIQSRVYNRIVCDISNCASREDIVRQIRSNVRLLDREGCFLIILEGRYSQQLNLEEDEFWLNDQINALGLFHFVIVNHAKPDFDLSFYRNQKGIIGLFVRKMEECMKRNPEQTKECELALYKGLEALCATKKPS